MKDLERIKSEDLGCQVQDANPANFAIEQEVAQLVGATVPAPTEPSADDARELGAQLLVFLRRALTPIQTALRTAVAAIYAHLDSRCTAYTPAAYASYMPLPPYDPMGTPPTPRTLPNLLTALTAFSARKISDLGDCPDGVSLLHMVCDSTVPVTELKDDNKGWVSDKKNYLVNLLAALPTVTKVSLGCKKITNGLLYNVPTLHKLDFPELEEVDCSDLYSCISSNINSDFEGFSFPKLRRWNGSMGLIGGINGCETGATVMDEIEFPALEYVNQTWRGLIHCYTGFLPSLKRLYFPVLEYSNRLIGGIYGPPSGLEYIYFGYKTNDPTQSVNIGSCTSPNLLDIELKNGYGKNLNLGGWNPSNLQSNLTTFLQNFREHIALRLTANGTGLTLTLSQAVFDTIWNADGTPKSTDPDSVIYQINKIIKTDKHWSVNRA